jgi:hypothetical protein
LPFGMRHSLQEHADMREIELVRWRLGQLMAERKHARDCGLVGHWWLWVFYRGLGVTMREECPRNATKERAASRPPFLAGGISAVGHARGR